MTVGTSDTGDPLDYDDSQCEEILDHLLEAFGGLGPLSATPTALRVSNTRVQWNGAVDRSNGGRRTTTIPGLSLDRVRSAVAKGKTARELAARPTSYSRRGTTPRVKHLARTAAGRAALGELATPRTVKTWLAGGRPSKANREAIDRVYEAAAERVARSRTTSVAGAAREAADALSAALRAETGAEVRFTEIGSMTLQ